VPPCLHPTTKGDAHAVDDHRDLLVLWLLGLSTAYTLGGFIHILLVIAVVILVVRLMQGRRPSV
jgi:hypothetical protein